MPNGEVEQSVESPRRDMPAKVGPKKHSNRQVGVVDSISGRKTVRIVVERLTRHPLYGKYIRRRTKLLVHDPEERARLGDTVEVELCRPISKTKAWRLVRVVKTAQVQGDIEESPQPMENQ